MDSTEKECTTQSKSCTEGIQSNCSISIRSRGQSDSGSKRSTDQYCIEAHYEVAIELVSQFAFQEFLVHISYFDGGPDEVQDSEEDRVYYNLQEVAVVVSHEIWIDLVLGVDRVYFDLDLFIEANVWDVKGYDLEIKKGMH